MLSDLNPEWIPYILMNMEDAVCLTGKNGELLYANPAAEKLFSLDICGHARIWDAIPYVEGNDSLIQLFIDGVMEKRKSLRSLVDYYNNEGTRFRLHVTLTCESGEQGMILIVVHDLTSLVKVHSAFARYTSPEIADYVLTTPGGEKQGGQNREVSILMSDLRGFTAMSTRLSSDDLISMLNHYFENMAAVIQHFRGTVIEFLGDGIFVVFGAPQDLPDHATAAVSCAVGMQNALTEVNVWNREHGFPELAMGIGIHSGTVVAGNIGSDQKMKYGCMGETVNLAGRLESFCLGGQIYISDDTRKMISETLTVVDEMSFMPKGGREEMRVFCIAGIGDNFIKDATGETHWKVFPEAKPLLYYILDNKTVRPDQHTGFLAKLSTDHRFGILVTDSVLQPMQNLMLRIDEMDIYAKITERQDNGYVIGFTETPEGFGNLFA